MARIQHQFADGKYEVVFDDTPERGGVLFVARRHGEEWRSLTGDGLILAMIQRVDDLTHVNTALLAALDGLIRAYGASDGRNGNSGECWDAARAAIASASTDALEAKSNDHVIEGGST